MLASALAVVLVLVLVLVLVVKAPDTVMVTEGAWSRDILRTLFRVGIFPCELD